MTKKTQRACKSAQHKPNTRISGRLREAVRLMVEDGLVRAVAAQKAGLTDHGLYCALQKPHVRALRRDLLEALRTSEASRTVSRVAALADGAESEHVRLESNKWLAGIDGVTPVTRGETRHIHENAAPGLVINYIAREAPMIDVTPMVVKSPGRAALPLRVAHPSERKVEST